MTTIAYLPTELFMDSPLDLLPRSLLQRAGVIAGDFARLCHITIFGVQLLLVLHHLLISITDMNQQLLLIWLKQTSECISRRSCRRRALTAARLLKR